MAKLYQIKNRFQLLQISMVDPSGKPASRIFAKGLNENVPEWMLNQPDVKRFIKLGYFKVVEDREPSRKKPKQSKVDVKPKTQKPKTEKLEN